MPHSLDKIAWKTLHDRPRPEGTPKGLAHTNRPANYSELGELVQRGVEWEIAWGEFLHEFMLYRQASFFTEPPPERFPIEYQALLAGAAEFLCEEFQLPVPAWVHDARYRLEEPWEPGSWMWAGATEEENKRRWSRAHPALLRHNVIFESRDLITL